MKPNVKRHAVVQPPDKSTRLIPLTQGQNTVVDTADFDWANQWNWQASWNPDVKGFYATRKSPDGTIYMHRELLHCESEHTDHWNKNTLDNRRQNLRPCSMSSNHGNSKRYATNTSGYKGVTWDKARRQWHVRIHYQGRKINLGRFPSALEAAIAYDRAAVRLFGEFAHINFPSN